MTFFGRRLSASRVETMGGAAGNRDRSTTWRLVFSLLRCALTCYAAAFFRRRRHGRGHPPVRRVMTITCWPPSVRA